MNSVSTAISFEALADTSVVQRLENVTHSCAKALNDELQDTIFDR